MTQPSDDNFTITVVAYSVWRDRLYRVLRHWPRLYRRVTGYYPGPEVSWSSLQGDKTEVFTAAKFEETRQRMLNGYGRRWL